MKTAFVITILLLANLSNFNCFTSQQEPPDQFFSDEQSNILNQEEFENRQMRAAKHAGQKRTAGAAQLSSEENDSDKRQKLDLEQKKEELAELFRILLGKVKNNKRFDGEIEKIKKIYESGIDVNTSLIIPSSNFPISLIASYPVLTDLAKWLIGKGADVNTTERGYTVLDSAYHSENLDLVQFLINQGANINNTRIRRDILKYGYTTEIEKQIIKLLLLNGLKFNIQDFTSGRPQRKQLVNELMQEIVTEYRKKIHEFNERAKEKFKESFKLGQPGQILPPELVNIINEYLIPQYKTGNELIDNIMNIRYTLGELSEKQKEKFELEQQERHQQQQAASAGGSSGGAAAGSAAAASVAASIASQGISGGAAAMTE